MSTIAATIAVTIIATPVVLLRIASLLGRDLPIRVVADDRAADLAGIPPEVRMLPAAQAAGRLPELTTTAIGTARAGGLTLTLGRHPPRQCRRGEQVSPSLLPRARTCRERAEGRRGPCHAP